MLILLIVAFCASITSSLSHLYVTILQDFVTVSKDLNTCLCLNHSWNLTLVSNKYAHQSITIVSLRWLKYKIQGRLQVFKKRAICVSVKSSSNLWGFSSVEIAKEKSWEGRRRKKKGKKRKTCTVFCFPFSVSRICKKPPTQMPTDEEFTKFEYQSHLVWYSKAILCCLKLNTNIQ